MVLTMRSLELCVCVHVYDILLHVMLLSIHHQVFTWGCNDEGALGRTVDDEYTPGQVNELSSKIVQVSAGDSHTAALDDQGCVYCWGVFRVSYY